jgi:hypothetical protein
MNTVLQKIVTLSLLSALAAAVAVAMLSHQLLVTHLVALVAVVAHTLTACIWHRLSGNLIDIRSVPRAKEDSLLQRL